MSRQAAALEVAKQIHELEAKLAALHERFAELVPNDVPSPLKPVNGTHEGTATDQVFAYMRERPGRIIQVSKIAEDLSHLDTILVRNTVYRLWKFGRLKKHEGRGAYSYEPTIEEGT